MPPPLQRQVANADESRGNPGGAGGRPVQVSEAALAEGLGKIDQFQGELDRLKTEFQGAKPAIERLVQIEGDIRLLVERLSRMSNRDAAGNPGPTVAEAAPRAATPPKPIAAAAPPAAVPPVAVPTPAVVASPASPAPASLIATASSPPAVAAPAPTIPVVDATPPAPRPAAAPPMSLLLPQTSVASYASAPAAAASQPSVEPRMAVAPQAAAAPKTGAVAAMPAAGASTSMKPVEPAASTSASASPMVAPAAVPSAVSPTPEKPAVAPARTAAGIGIHLASYRHPEEAAQGWKEISARLKNAFGSLQPVVSEFEMPKGGGLYYRLKAGPFPNTEQAQTACHAVKQSFGYCEVVDYSGRPL